MQLKLVVTNKHSSEVSETLLEVEDRVVIGRQITSPVLLQGEALSRQHLSIALRDGRLTAENLSRNGTTLNGESLPMDSPAPLAAGDVLEVPGYEMRVELPEETAAASAEGAAGRPAAAPETPGKRVVRTVTHLLDPLEIILVLCALAGLALTTYYILS